MLCEEVIHEIDTLVRTRAHDRAELITIFREEMYEPGELDVNDIEAQVDASMAALTQEQLSWPPITDFDRLESAFAELNDSGVLALFDAGYTQSDGHEDFQTALENHDAPANVIGYCFYHGQDAERAVEGGGLFLAFGPKDPKDEETKGAEIGRLVRDALEREGLKVDWNGAFSKRIFLPEFKWQRR